MNEGANTDVAKPDRAASLADKVRALRLADKLEHGRGGSGGPMRLLLVVVLVLIVGVGYNVFATHSIAARVEHLESKQGPGDSQGTTPGKDAVIDSAATERKEEIALQYKGFVTPISLVQVSPQVGGKVIELNLKEGDAVDKGKILARIEDTEFKADYDRAIANLAAAKSRWNGLWKYRDDEVLQVKAELDDAQAQRDQLLAEYRRSEALRGLKAVPTRDFEEAQSKYLSVETRVVRLRLAYNLLKKGPRDEQIGAAKAEVELAQAELDKAQWRLRNCTIAAPITGVILTKKTELHNQVNPSAFSNGLSASLCEMADLSELEVDVSIVERDRSRVKLAQECRIRVDSWPGKTYTGYVSRIMPQADRSKNAIPVRVKLDLDSKEILNNLRHGGPVVLPEMSAVVTFLNEVRKTK